MSDNEEFKICPKCNQKNSMNSKTCSVCNYNFDEEFEQEKEEFHCVHCHSSDRVNKKGLCAKCRTKRIWLILGFSCLATLIYNRIIALIQMSGYILGGIQSGILVLILMYPAYKIPKIIFNKPKAPKKTKQIKLNKSAITKTEPTNELIITEEKNNKKIQYCKLCGGKIDNNTKKCTLCKKQYFKFKINSKAIRIVTFILITVALISANICQYLYTKTLSSQLSEKDAQIQELNKTIDSKSERINQLKKSYENDQSRLDEANEKLNFYERYSAIVVGGTGYYHTYSCYRVSVALARGDSFRIYNVSAAEDNGYYPCSRCH